MSIYMILQTESVISVSKGGNMGNLNETLLPTDFI
mgnify:CR=1 FL=1